MSTSFIDLTREYFTSMQEIQPEIRPNIKRHLQAASQGDQEAKEILARQLESHCEFIGQTPSESLYPNVPVYLSYIYHTFGQMALDAVLFQSPFIENVWIFEGRPIMYKEHGQMRTYPYVPTEEEMETLQTEISHITGGTIHAKRSKLSGTMPLSRLRIQMYCPPRSRRTIIVRRPDQGHLTLETMEMDEKVRKLIQQIARSRSSIIIAGGMDTGKTTLERAMILEKDPTTNSLTTFEQIPELYLGDLWGQVVVEMFYVQEEPFESSYGEAFRNSTRSVAVGEARYPFEAHYVLESAHRSPGFTFSTMHLKVSSPDNALRTFESLVYQYRKSDREGIRQDIATGIEFFIMLDSDDETGKRYVSSIFCPDFDEKTERCIANHLVYFDETETVNDYVWTGKKIPLTKRRLFKKSEVDIRVLEELGVW